MSDMTVKTIDLDSASDSREDLNAMPFLFTPRKEEIELDANLVNWVEAWYDRVMDEIIQEEARFDQLIEFEEMKQSDDESSDDMDVDEGVQAQIAQYNSAEKFKDEDVKEDSESMSD